jgi:hypothetical protein
MPSKWKMYWGRGVHGPVRTRVLAEPAQVSRPVSESSVMAEISFQVEVLADAALVGLLTAYCSPLLVAYLQRAR